MRRMIGVITVLVMSQAAATAEPQQIDLDVPSTTVAATVQINVKPSKGAVLLYTGPSYDKPIRFPGPSLNWSRGQSHSALKSLGVLMASMDRKSNLRRDDPSSCLMSDGWSMSRFGGLLRTQVGHRAKSAKCQEETSPQRSPNLSDGWRKFAHARPRCETSPRLPPILSACYHLWRSWRSRRGCESCDYRNERNVDARQLRHRIQGGQHHDTRGYD
jgi:hypothetical protein